MTNIAVVVSIAAAIVVGIMFVFSMNIIQKNKKNKKIIIM